MEKKVDETRGDDDDYYHNLPNEFPYDLYEENSSTLTSVDGMAPPSTWTSVNRVHCISMKQRQLMDIHKKLQWHEKIEADGKTSYWPSKNDQDDVQIKKKIIGGTGVYIPPNPAPKLYNSRGKKPSLPPPPSSPVTFSDASFNEKEEDERLIKLLNLPSEWTY